MTATTNIPNDRALPAIVATLAAGLASAIPALALEDRNADLLLRGYTPGKRATFELRAGHHRFAVKAYAEDPALEAALYEALAAEGLAGNSGVRVPPLLARDSALRVLVIGWLEGPTAKELVEAGQGKHAGELAARWLRRAASLPVKFGPPIGAARILDKARHWVAALVAVDPALGTAATAVAGILARTQPRESTPHLVHGSLYARHILDLGDDPGVIDWERFGQGPLEFDAGVFLATTWRIGLSDEILAGQAAQAEEALLAGTVGLLDGRTLAWHRAAMLLRLANKMNRRLNNDDWQSKARALLREAGRLAEAAG